MAKQPKKVEADYHALAKESDMVWVGHDPPANSTETTEWRCNNGASRQ